MEIQEAPKKKKAAPAYRNLCLGNGYAFFTIAKYTKNEIAMYTKLQLYLINNWKKTPLEKMASKTGKTKKQLKAECATLNIDPITENDIIDGFILDNWESCTISGIVKISGFSHERIRPGFKRLGLTPLSQTEVTVKAILDCSKNQLPEEIAEILDIHIQYVLSLCRENNIVIDRDKIITERGGSEQQRVIAKANYVYTHPDEYAKDEVWYAGVILEEHNLKRRIDRAPKAYGQSGSPMGLADELRGISIIK